MIYLSGIRDCDCHREKHRVMTTMRITKELTFLICLSCGGKIGEWSSDKIRPSDSDFTQEDKERLK